MDGSLCGHLMIHPLEVPLGAGKELTLTLYGTMRNLLGPHHHLEGELPAVGPDSFAPNEPISPANWADRYCMVTFGDLGRIQIDLRR